MGSLHTVLSEIVDSGNLLVVQPGGNHGDSLIYKGSNKIINGANITKIPLRGDEIRNDKPRKITANPISNIKLFGDHWAYCRHRINSEITAIYINGGGNFNDLYGGGIRCYKTVARYFNCPIIIGPQSCQFNNTDPTEIFERVNNETHFFCREKYSYEIISSATAQCEHVTVYLSDDTALSIEKNDLPINHMSLEYTLLAMRNDKDSADPRLKGNITGPVRVRDISKMEEDFSDWVSAAAHADLIHTDRLHVAILGAILGKPVEMYDTGYHKNRGVYEYRSCRI